MSEPAFRVESKGDFKLLRPEGPLIVTSIIPFKKVIEDLMKGEEKFIAIDFKMVPRLDSSGLGLLRNLHNQISSEAGMLILFNVCIEVIELFSIAGMAKVFRILKDEQEFESNFNI